MSVIPAFILTMIIVLSVCYGEGYTLKIQSVLKPTALAEGSVDRFGHHAVESSPLNLIMTIVLHIYVTVKCDRVPNLHNFNIKSSSSAWVVTKVGCLL